jgi:hypothetical protein
VILAPKALFETRHFCKKLKFATLKSKVGKNLETLIPDPDQGQDYLDSKILNKY